jgi:SCY1-like protein 1
MGNSSSSLPYSIDNQVGAPHDHNGWALHHGKSTDGSQTPVTVFVGKKPVLSKTPVNPRFKSQMQLVPALHHYNHCRKLRHPQILKVYATLDTDNPAASAAEGGAPAAAASAAAASSATTGDLIIVTEPCIPLSQWLLEKKPSPEQLAWGLECVVQGLNFLHNSAKLAHGNIHPSSLYVTLSGDVKLWNFSLVTPVGPNGGGPTLHFQQWEQACTPESYRSPERQSQSWNAIENAGVHAMDSYSLGILISEDWYNRGKGMNRVPAPLQKAVQRMQTPNLKMRPRLQPLLKCPVFDTPYQKMQLQLEEITIQPVEQKVQLWQQLGQQLQQGGGGNVPKDVALHKILPLIIQSLQTICNSESMLAQDMYRREVLAMLLPLFYIEEHYQDPSRIGPELAPLVARLFLVPDRGVRSVLLNQVGFMSKHLDKNALNSSVFEPLCSGFNDSSPALRELTLKATLSLVPSLHSPSMEKLSRYLVRLQGDTETSIRTNAVIFIARIAPHLSEVSKQKMLLPAYGRAMKDTFAPCRLSALQSTSQSKSLFSMQDLATKVLPSVMPLTLDPMLDVRKEAFRVVKDMLKDLEEESARMQSTDMPQDSAAAAAATNGVAPAPASGGSGGYLSGFSSWVAGSATSAAQPSGSMSTTMTTPTKPVGAPATSPMPAAPQPPVQKFGSSSFVVSAPAASAADDGWGDNDGDDEGWGDDDVEEDPFASIGTKTVAAAPAPASRGGFGVNDDPFATMGMSTNSVKPRGSSGKLVLPKKTNLTAKKVAAPPATKLTMDDDGMDDGWDDF